MRIPIPFLWISTIVCLLLGSCAKIDDISLGYTDDQLGVIAVDSFTVESATVLLDPLPSSATGRLLLGAIEDDLTGKVSSATYFRLSNPSFSVSDLPNDIRFDSLSMRLFYDGYYYGDTTSMMTLRVHRLQEDIELTELSNLIEDDEYPVFVSGSTIYSNKSLAYDNSALGICSFFPKPTSTTDTVHFRLSDVLGNELLQMMLNNDNRVSNEDDFVSFFKGLAVIPDADAASILGFQDSVVMSLNYSYVRQSDGRRVSASVDFSIGATAYQYNNVSTDREGTKLSTLSFTNQELSSKDAEERVFIQGVSGLVTKLRFPTVRTALNSSIKAISKAELTIETDQDELGDYLIPGSLLLMKANKYNTPTALLTNLSGTTVQATYQSGSIAGVKGRGKYVFNVTDYISNLKNSTSYQEDESLLLSLPTTDLLSAVNTLRIASDGGQPAIKLKVIYVNFN